LPHRLCILEVMLNLSLELRQDSDGRWVAEVPALPGVWARAASRAQAVAEAKLLAAILVLEMYAADRTQQTS
jgi:predicted RNase H-like HicB family nuclease